MVFAFKSLMEVALRKKPADRVLKNCRIVNVFSGEIEEGDIALQGGYIAGIGQYDGIEEIDIKGKTVCPGLMDAHVHIESSMVTPPVFASVVLTKGTTSVVADPHEIANVLGVRGVEYMLDVSRDLALTVYIMIPSCVPATSFETAGAVITAKDIESLIEREGVLGLGEMMNYPGVLAMDEEVLAKISAAKGRVVDGHGAGLRGYNLSAYRLAGISTDHECVSVKEAEERIRLGMYVAIREGTAAKNLQSLLPAVNDHNWWQFMFCTDDRHLEDVVTKGHIDFCIRKSIGLGLPPITAVRLATINVARCYNIKDRGAIAPGYRGDMIVVDNIRDFNVEEVYVSGQKVAKNGRMLKGTSGIHHPMPGGNTINIASLSPEAFKIRGKDRNAPVIGIIPGSIETAFEYHEMDIKDGILLPPAKSDILKIAVVERHRATGNVCTGFVRGMGLKNGAIASSVAHDSHNIIVVGDDDALMMQSLAALQECGGGYCVTEGRTGDKIVLPLPVAGLMSDRTAEEVVYRLRALIERARDMGVHSNIDPFMTLSFMALPVIGRLKITDRGLFDVDSFKFVEW